MREGGRPGDPAGVRRTARDRLLVAAGTLALLAPFLTKAVHMDDPLFLWTARQILDRPLDFYGFAVNWYGVEEPMAVVMKNPPLAAYYLAAVAAVAGWREAPLHAAMLGPAVAAALGTYALAARFTRRPLLATLLGVASPVFVVSGTTLMGDMAMLACFVWAVALWVRGLDEARAAWLGVAAGLATAAGLSKYFGVSLVPLLVAYTLVRTRRLDPRLLWLGLPAIAMAGYHAATAAMYGQGLLLDAAGYAVLTRAGSRLGLAGQTVVGLSFTGPCLVTVALLVAAHARPWLLATAAGAGLGAAALGPGLLVAWPVIAAGPTPGVLPLLGAGVAAGTVVVLVVLDGWRRPDDAGLLSLWALGTLIFSAYLNWTANGRTLLPLAPVSGLLAVRWLEAKGSSGPAWRTAWPVTVGAAMALAAGAADHALAASARTAARLAIRETPPGRSPWFQGHWGFQYYLAMAGGRPLDWDRSTLQPGDVVVVPLNNTNLRSLPEAVVTAPTVLGAGGPRGLTTMSKPAGAGFYSDVWGPNPFGVGRIPPERYLVYTVVAPTRCGPAGPPGHPGPGAGSGSGPCWRAGPAESSPAVAGGA